MPLFLLLVERWELSERRLDRRAGEIVAAQFNTTTRSKESDKVWTWLDIFPDPSGRPAPDIAPAEMSDEEMLAVFETIAGTRRRRRNVER